MTIEELDILDDLIFKLSNSTNAQELLFDKAGYPITPSLDQSIAKEAEDFIMDHSPQFLYKYKTASQYDLDALWNNQIWLSTMKEYNDPYEAQYIVDYEAIANNLIKSDDSLVRLMQAKRITKSHPIYRTFLTEVKQKSESLKAEIDMKRCRLFTSCFSENKSSLLMWAHYAKCHEGICICYKHKDLAKTFGPLNIVPIRYSDKLLKISSIEKEDYHQIFLRTCQTKSTEWAYEKEWRLLGRYRINEPYSKGCLVDAPAPHSIYMGVCIKESTKTEIVELCKSKGIKLYQMRLSDTRYGLLSYPVGK